MINYIAFFGFKTEPFSTDVAAKNLLKLPSMVAVKERFDYVMNGGVFVVTGEVGSGKSTSLRWAQSHFHPSQYRFMNVVATSGSIIELYRQLCWELDINTQVANRTRLLKIIKDTIREIATTKKQKLAVVVDEAHLLKPDVFAELHTVNQFDHDSKNLFSVILAGQANLLDKLTYRASMPLASRVITRTHLNNLDLEQVKVYIEHHLHIAGVKKQLFSESAITAIFQASAGILRKINHLAKGGLIAAATENQQSVSAEHIRIAATELI